MAHKQQQDFCLRVARAFPEHFERVRVLDIGSYDVNGTNRHLFKQSTYVGVDARPGPCVDVVCKGHEFKSDLLFDTVISTEVLEHDYYWRETIDNMHRCLTRGGLMVLTMAGPGRVPHGNEWASALNHYENIPMMQLMDAVGIDNFKRYAFEIDIEACDTYFWGLRK